MLGFGDDGQAVGLGAADEAGEGGHGGDGGGDEVVADTDAFHGWAVVAVCVFTRFRAGSLPGGVEKWFFARREGVA